MRGGAQNLTHNQAEFRYHPHILLHGPLTKIVIKIVLPFTRKCLTKRNDRRSLGIPPPPPHTHTHGLWLWIIHI